MRSVFMGTPAFAVPSLLALAEVSDVVGVVSQPDKARGRGLASSASPVAAAAVERGFPLIRPGRVRDAEVEATLAEWRPDLLVVAAYGRILPPALLALPSIAPINVHASLLPRHRGAAPIAGAILAGDTTTGVTIMLMAEEMDAGDVLLQRELPIAHDDTTESLTRSLAALGGVALRDACAVLAGDGLAPVPQDAALVTYAPRLTKEDGRVRWSDPAVVIERRIRAFTPWPSAFTSLHGRSVKLVRARVAATEPAASSQPGTVLAVGDAVRVATGAGALEVLVLQMEGKRALDARAFVAGARLAPGMRFDG